MRILVDTNVLVRLAHIQHPQQPIACDALRRLRDADHELRIVPQVLYEYWAVATRPAHQNGLGFTVEDVFTQLQQWQEVLLPLRDERGILGHWQRLVLEHRVQGKQSHDARLAAAAARHGLTHLLTFNTGDFERYTGLRVLDPQVVASGAA
jgi:predicted nucleic acid-binding protein